ncbi:hypothetical protein ACFL3D_06460, partial [Candidatus Omnitrophota bacterium]
DTLTVDGSGLSQFVNGRMQIGSGSHTGIADDNSDLYVVGDVEIRKDLSIGGDTTIAGVVFGDDYTQISGSLSVTENLDLGGYLYDSGDGIIEIYDDLSISGNTTIAGVVFGDDHTEIDGSLTVTNDIDVRGNIFDGAGNIIELLDDVSIDGYLSVAGQIYPTIMPGTASTEFGIDTNDMVTTPTLKFTDATQDETLRWNDNASLETFELSDDVSILGELTISDNKINFYEDAYIQNKLNTTLEFSQTYIVISGDTTVNDDLTVLGTHTRMGNMSMYIGDASLVTEASDSGSVFVGKDLTVVGNIYAQRFSSGAFAMDGVLPASFIINKPSSPGDQDLSLSFSDDGDDNAHYILWDDGNDSFEFFDDISVNGALTVRDELIVTEGNMRLLNSVEIGDVNKASALYSISGEDLFVENDVEIGGTLLLDDDLTLGGVVFDQNYAYIKNNLTVSGDVDLRKRVFNGSSEPLHVFDELSVSGDLNLQGARLIGRNNEYMDLGVMGEDTISVYGDLETGDNVTIIGNLSVAGIIKTFQELYVDEIGDTMTGTLNINVGGEGNLGLDVDGNIEYTGTLKNQSPVKFQDGIEIINLGGISGGQLPRKDVMIFVDGDIILKKQDNVRELIVPDIHYVRYAKCVPEIHEGQKKVAIENGKISLGLDRNEHIITIQVEDNPFLVNNVSLDGELKNAGDFKITGHNKISLLESFASEGEEIQVTFTYRRDVYEKHISKHYREKSSDNIGNGWYIVYLEEKPLNIVTMHDTAAMSTKTELVINVVPLKEYQYSADTYVIAVVSEEGTITQYH